MKTFLFALAFILGGLFALCALLGGDLIGLGFWLLVAYVCHRFAFGK